MRSRLLAALLLLAAPLARAEERAAPPPPQVRGPAMPLARPSPPAAAPHAAEPGASAPAAPEAAPPTAPSYPTAPAADAHAPPATEKASLEDHAATAVPGLAPDAARPAAGDAAAAPAAGRGPGPSKREPQGGPREPPVPPSLTGRALAEELRRSAGGRASEKEALAAERARLDMLSREIAEARAALKVETERLGALVSTTAAKGRKPGVKGAPPPLETLARTVKSMKADQAAALLGRVDRSLAAALLERMKPAEAAAVLDRMDGATSAALVALIARRDST